MKLVQRFKVTGGGGTKNHYFDVPKGVKIKKVILMSNTYTLSGELVYLKMTSDDWTDFNIYTDNVFLYWTKITVLNGAAGVEENGAVGMVVFDLEGHEVESEKGKIHFGITNSTAGGEWFILILITDEKTRDD
jgi:hypothetical protein